MKETLVDGGSEVSGPRVHRPPDAPVPSPENQAALRRKRRTAVTRPWLLLAPSLVVLAGLLLWPLIQVGKLSMEDYEVKFGGGVSTFTGLDHYTDLLSSSLLWKTVLPNTLFFAVACVGLTVALGTAVALLLQRLGPAWRLICSISVLSAWAMPAVTGTYVWIWLFQPQDGMFSQLAGTLGMIDPATTNWFTERIPFYAIATLNVVHHGFPFVAITVFAGLLTIPKELYEAGMLDGANAWQRFWKITVPTIKPVFLVVTILSTIWDFKVFTQIFLMPGGSGSNPDVYNLGVYSYIQAFAKNDYGTGAASAVLLTLLLLAITVFYIRTLFKQGEEDL
ncbi:Inner membrane ABC transporter permease protein YcjO [Streptomyces sp. YIM 130001]|uniref:carbohydrate ABC transporter permease n=1 Tax=Streptomyces sp. YIM 130001 TaxID=2259644 RepID=UPI000E6493E7|nr:sugar ABC transporter permease [Streptomyces sp. YIM 130001]RII18356.1 Inner membrane ABC transporter permease protein YcjO [Streptomyces sp. YIM 130001]